MPKGTAFDLEALATWEEKEVKKVGEEAHAVIFTPASNKRFRLSAFWIWVSTAETIFTLEDGTTAFFNGVAPKTTPVYVPLPGQGYLGGLGNKLQIKMQATQTKVVATWYGIEDVT
ncbi:MAG TPA: hypothetical protein VMT20_06975 [Terriglobia bacterium]|nr:hypothetical protein [Terriglobia bacterium]